MAVSAAKMADGGAPSWRMSLPHVCVATLTSFLFGYHSGCVPSIFSFLLLVVVVFPTHGVERVRVIGWFGAGS